MKKLVVMLAVLLLIGGMAAALLWQQAEDERDANAALQARVTALEAPVATGPASAAPTSETATLATASPEVAAPATGVNAQQAESMIAGMRQMMTSPEYREMARTQARMNMTRQYPYLAAELGLSPAEVDKFYDLLARQQTDLTADTVGLGGGANMDGAAMQEMQRELAAKRQANEAEIAAALGGKYPQWQAYQQSQPLRQQVAQLQSQLGGDGDGLSDAQARQLVATLAAEKTRIDQEQRSAPRPPAGTTREQMLAMQTQLLEQRRTDTNRRLLEAAGAHLTPQQVASYKRMLDQEQEMERLLMRSMESQRAGQAQVGTTAAPAR